MLLKHKLYLIFVFEMFSYVRAARDWASWVNTPASERHAFYKDTLRDPDRWNTVNLELKKIQCFSCIL